MAEGYRPVKLLAGDLTATERPEGPSEVVRGVFEVGSALLQEMAAGTGDWPERRGVAVRALRELPGLLRPTEAFKVLGLPRSTGYGWIRRGLLPTKEHGGRMWIRTVDMAAEIFGVTAAELLGDRVEG